MFFLERLQIGHGCNRHNSLEKTLIGHGGLKCRISAIGPSDDAEFGGISNALRHQPASGIEHVANRDPPRSEAVPMQPRLPIPGGPAKIGLQYREAARRIVLR